MQRQARIVMLAVLLVAFAATTGCGPSAAARVDRTDRPWEGLPGDVMGIAHVDVRALLDSELTRSVDPEGRIPAEVASMLEEFEKISGFDIESDLESITVGFSGNTGAEDGPFYMIVHGKFDASGFERYAQSRGEVKTETLEGLTTYVTRTSEDDASPSVVAAFPNEETMIVAPALDFPKLARSVRGATPSSAAETLTRLVSDGGGQVFVAIDVPEEVKEMAVAPPSDDGFPINLLSNLQEPLRRLETVLMTLDFSKGFELALEAEADTAESGKLLHDTVQGLMAMGRMMAADQPEKAALWDQAGVRLDGTRVKLSLALTREQVEMAMHRPATSITVPEDEPPVELAEDDPGSDPGR